MALTVSYPVAAGSIFRRHLRLTTSAGALIYIAATAAFLISRGSWPTPDFLIPPLVLVAVVNGRGWQFVVDWVPFLLLTLAYEGFRGVADDLNTRVHMIELINADKWLIGRDITAPNLLQTRFYDPGRVAWYDWFASILHMMHFVLPLAVGFGIWLMSRRTFWRFVTSILVLFLAGFVTYYAYPAAPPWMAGDFGLIPPVQRVLLHTLVHLPATRGLSSAYDHFSPNLVAAMPSLHAALPLLVSFILISLLGRKALPVLLYPLAGAVAWMYLGEHYAVDVLAGWFYAVVVFVGVWVAPPFLARHFAGLRQALAGLKVPAVQAPAWPLAALSVFFIAVVWVQPVVRAPINPEAEAAAAEAGHRHGALVVAALADLGPVDCAGGRSTSILLDRVLDPIATDYGAYIQGLRSSTCLSLSVGRKVDPLSGDDLRTIDIASASTLPVVLNLPDALYLTYVRTGHPSEQLRAVTGVRANDVLVVVIRVDSAENAPPIEAAISQIAGVAFTSEEGPLEGVENCGGECPAPDSGSPDLDAGTGGNDYVVGDVTKRSVGRPSPAAAPTLDSEEQPGAHVSNLPTAAPAGSSDAL